MASRKVDKLKAAGADMDKFFSKGPETVTEGPEKTADRSNGTAQEKSIEKPKKAVKKVFSFRAESDKVDSWRLWADAAGIKVDDLGTEAINEYIRKHPLTEDQKKIYELKAAQKEEKS